MNNLLMGEIQEITGFTLGIYIMDVGTADHVGMVGIMVHVQYQHILCPHAQGIVNGTVVKIASVNILHPVNHLHRKSRIGRSTGNQPVLAVFFHHGLIDVDAFMAFAGRGNQTEIHAGCEKLLRVVFFMYVLNKRRNIQSPVFDIGKECLLHFLIFHECIQIEIQRICPVDDL